MSLSAGDIDIDVDVWKLGYYVVTTDPETGERRRLEDFEFSMEFTEVNCEGGPVYKLCVIYLWRKKKTFTINTSFNQQCRLWSSRNKDLQQKLSWWCL